MRRIFPQLDAHQTGFEYCIFTLPAVTVSCVHVRMNCIYIIYSMYVRMYAPGTYYFNDSMWISLLCALPQVHINTDKH